MGIILTKKMSVILLLIIAATVTTVSAAVYFSLIAQPTVTISQTPVIFEQGSDWPSGSSLGANSTYVSLAIKAYPNATLTYEEPLNISNIDSAAQDIRLRHVSITPASGSASVSNFTFINFTLFDETGAYKGSLNYTTTGDTWSTPSMGFTAMDASDEWYIMIQTKATAGAEANIVANIVIAVDVQ